MAALVHAQDGPALLGFVVDVHGGALPGLVVRVENRPDLPVRVEQREATALPLNLPGLQGGPLPPSRIEDGQAPDTFLACPNHRTNRPRVVHYF